ncbi:alpha/beta fold hydrolase [Belnapia sp. F-4-1]|uniref:alpha/beta fold hydrolase n=1 Tax=Belnapia sp. F-4-1 TaxID=1545443 RepID=UPI001917012C|nr:alpha/beta hydrolase [Belnapia sp. F-4-1]
MVLATALAVLTLQACTAPEVGPTAAGAEVQPHGQRGSAPPPQHLVEANGVKLRFVERGSGDPPVVLLHGDGSMIEDFATSGLLDLSAGAHRVLAFDRPGYGHSERPRARKWTPEAQAEVLAAALAQLGVERPIVVGHSWGTLVALALALDHPAAVSGLVLVSGYYYPVPRPAAALAALPAVPVLGDAMRYTVAPVLSALLSPGLIAKAFDPAPVPPRFAAGFPVWLTLGPGHIRASAEDSGLLMPSAAGFEHRYGELRLPVAIVAGADDRIVDPGLHSVRLHRELPGSTLRVVRGQGHMVHHGAADTVANAVEAVASAARQAPVSEAVRLPCLAAGGQPFGGSVPLRYAARRPCVAVEAAHSASSR